MDITVSEMHRATLLEVAGRVDSTNATKLGDALNEQIDAGRVRLVLDLGKVDYMSSAGLRELVAARNKLKSSNGDLRIASPSPYVKDTLTMVGFDTLFRIFDTQVEAVGSY